MNLPEYRRELRAAHESYAEAVAQASKKYVDSLIQLDSELRDRISQADIAFHEDPDMEPNEVPMRRRDHG